MDAAPLRRIVGATGMVVAVLAGVAPPLGFALEKVAEARGVLASAAEVARFIVADEAPAPDGRPRSLERFRAAAGHAPVAVRIVDVSGRIVLGEGAPVLWPSLGRDVSVPMPGGAGRVEVRTSLRPILRDAGWIASASALLALAAFHAFRVVPLRALDRTLAELEARNQRFDAALNNLSQGLCFFDGNQRLIVSNACYAEMYGLRPDQVRPGTTLREIVESRYAAGTCPVMTPEEYVAWRDAIAVSEVATDTEVELRNGRIFAIHHEPMADGGWVSTHKDITERRRAERALTQQNARFDAALENMSQGLCLFSGDMRLIVCNGRYAEIFGLSRDLTRPGTTLREIIEHRIAVGNFSGDPQEYLAERLRVAAAGRAVKEDLAMRDGRTIALVHRPMPDGGWLATFEDITERRQAEARIAHMAGHDALTGLANRVLFRDELRQALGRLRGEELAVLCLDLDRFKDVNDALGHPVGDELLRAVARRLGESVGDGGFVARLGGDEFAVVQAGVAQPAGATALARAVCEVLGAPYDLEGHRVVIGASVGIALAPADGTDPDQLLRNADMALYRAKADGRGAARFFEPEMDARMQARRALELDLRKALAAGEFELHYQPLIHLGTDQVSSFEALLRWDHPERGLVSPEAFIPLAEEIGFIVPLGEWVLREACRTAAGWPGGVKVAVNLSPAQFKSRNLVGAVVTALASSGLAASRLELEITESVLLANTEATLETLHRLRSLGVRIAMDDFGTGYSSLSYLRSFPFDKIKIDRSFIGDIPDKSDCLAIVRAVTGLGASLGMSTTAEGVETEAQLERLKAEGCTEVQGYLFSPPRPGSEIPALLARLRSAARSAA